MGSIDELTVPEYSEASKTPEANVAKAIENISAPQAEIIPLSSPLFAALDDDNEDSGASDEEPYFPFENRGKQKGQAAGPTPKATTIRPVKQPKVDKSDKVKADEVKADKKKRIKPCS